MNELLNNLEQLHTTELGIERIKRNLSLETDDVIEWCKNKISSEAAVITRNGKNWYVNVEKCVITVNAYSYTIITAHKEKKSALSPTETKQTAKRMQESGNVLCDDIRFLTERALWETENLMKCIPDELWTKRYDGIPMWKFLYHTLYSMDRWYINPYDETYQNPPFHMDTLADLNVIPKDECLSREQMERYFGQIRNKIQNYVSLLSDRELSEKPENCDMSRFRLILGQFRHWHRHMGVIYGFIIEGDGKWPYVLNMLGKYPDEPMPDYY